MSDIKEEIPEKDLEVDFAEATGVNIDYTNIDKFGVFDKMVVDADTLLFRSAVRLQENYILVTHKKTGKTKEFANKTKFWGHHLKKSGGWLADYNNVRVGKDLPVLTHDSFEVEEFSRPKEGIENHVKEGYFYFKKLIQELKNTGFAKEILILLGKGGNFRYDVAQTLKYKGKRKEKPIFFEKVKKAVTLKLSHLIELVEDKEVDDQMAVYGMENLRHFKNTGNWLYVLSYVDKDLKMIESPYFNYDNEFPAIEVINRIDAATWYGMQLLMGDKSTDNIQGLPQLTTEIKTKYELPNRKGVGEATTRKLLERCNKASEVFTIVCECYRSYYGDGITEFKSHEGKSLSWTWQDFLQETAMLIFMNPLKNPLKYNAVKHFELMGADIGG